MNQPLQKVNTHYTIILGAEGDLGRAMAREIARRGCNLILVSTTKCDLLRFAIGLQLNEDVQVEAYRLDLSDESAIGDFTARMKNRFEIRALINNVTCNWSVTRDRYIPEFSREDSHTRFRGAALFTWALLPHMEKLSSSYIQHIIPFPFRKEQFSPEMQESVGKMYAFARELDKELKHTSISVSLMHPAPIGNLVKEPEPTDGIPQYDTLDPGLIAQKAVNGMLRGDRLIIPGFWNRIQFFLNRQVIAWFRSAYTSPGSTLQPSV
ncbi:MAG TPA: SDR family NAD(P)-dependent oxidoreductase [Bacteroides sp.]|nr:SDR family NAD(P)-dependent oxidoreductase [Bacteroides sp.]